MGTAEEELQALARDLIEEIAQARALELAHGDDPGELELAVFNIRPFQRTQRVGKSGKVVHEQVRGHTESRLGGVPGVQMEHPGDLTHIGGPHYVAGAPGHEVRGNISEALWKANQWKKGVHKVAQGIQATRESAFPKEPEKGRAAVSWVRNGREARQHLDKAQQHLENAQSADNPEEAGRHLASAYESLRQAHKTGTEHVLPGANDARDAKHAHQHLDKIQAHMEALDKAVGANPKRTKQLLAGEREAGIRAGERQRPLNQLGNAIRETRHGMGLPGELQGGMLPHLNAAEEALQPNFGSGGPAGPEAMSEAYHALHEAHQAGVGALAHARTPEEKQQVRTSLDKIQAHMEALDKVAGTKPENTRRLLGTPADQQSRADRAKEASEQAAKEEKTRVPGYLAIGRQVVDPRFGADETATVTGFRPDYGGRVDLMWSYGREGSYGLKDAKELLRPVPGQPSPGPDFQMPSAPAETGMEEELKKAATEQWIGKRVQLKPGKAKSPREHVMQMHAAGGQGTVTGIPAEVWDMGAEDFFPNGEYGATYVTVNWDNGKSSMSGNPGVEVPLNMLEEYKPEPPKGAAAVHPNLGSHMARLPGDTISSRAYSHVPTPMAQAPPVIPSAESQALEQATKTVGQYAQRAEQRRQSDLSEHLSAIRAKEMEARGQPAPGTYQPLSDEEFASHVQDLETSIDEALRDGKATEKQHSVDGQGYVWSPDRSMLHADIIRDYMDRHVDVPSDRAALFVGGLPGAGKSSLLKNHPSGDLLKQYAVVNPDEFKTELAKRGMIPEVPGMSPLEASALVHEESAYLADLAAGALQDRGKNMVFDVTMKNEGITRGRVAELKDHGYKVSAFFVDIPVEKSAERVVRRYRKGLESYRKGTNPLGSRYVPKSVVLAGEAEPGVSRARNTFEALKPELTYWERYDGTKGLPQLAEKSSPQRPPVGSTIPSAEALRQSLREPYVGSTEAEAQAAEHGTAP